MMILWCWWLFPFIRLHRFGLCYQSPFLLILCEMPYGTTHVLIQIHEVFWMKWWKMIIFFLFHCDASYWIVINRSAAILKLIMKSAMKNSHKKSYIKAMGDLVMNMKMAAHEAINAIIIIIEILYTRFYK